MNHITYQTEKEKVFEKLKASRIYQTYQQAFLHATGLPLTLQLPEDEGVPPCQGQANENLFCQMLNSGKTNCNRCVDAQNCLAKSEGPRATSISCFAGLKETRIPIQVGGEVVAVLKTGHVFVQPPTADSFKKVADALRTDGWSEAKIAKMEPAYFDGTVIDLQRYQGMVTLLAAFALQLAELANRIVIEGSQTEPVVVTRARQFIVANLEDPLSLDGVANHVGVSSFYFCKLFKQATSMTFTEYVNRMRVERAKRRLLKPDCRVTEVAYEVGYQSLSQFNRSFLKYAGESPTNYRNNAQRRDCSLSA